MVVSLPGGVFAMGSQPVHEANQDAPPHMVRVGPVNVAILLATHGEFGEVMWDRWLRQGPRVAHPVRCTFQAAEEFIRRVNMKLADEDKEDRVSLLTEVEWEYMARGPALDIRQYMKNHSLDTVSDLRDHVQREKILIENVIPVDPMAYPAVALALGRDICADALHPQFNALWNGPTDLYGWFGNPTLSGKSILDERTTLEDQLQFRDRLPVSLTERVNGYGISDVEGNVPEWVADIYDRDTYLDLPPEDPFNAPFREGEYRRRVIRSGYFYDARITHTAACRLNGYFPFHPDYAAGLRVKVSASRKERVQR